MWMTLLLADPAFELVVEWEGIKEIPGKAGYSEAN
jgi:hypothetical protein